MQDIGTTIPTDNGMSVQYIDSGTNFQYYWQAIGDNSVIDEIVENEFALYPLQKGGIINGKTFFTHHRRMTIL